MANEDAAPVNHSGYSVAAGTVGGAAGGALKGGAKGFLGGWGAMTLIGAGIGLTLGLILTGVISFPAIVASLGAISIGGFLKGALVTVLTLGGGALAATTIGPVVGQFTGIGGAAIGAAKGGAEASHTIRQERGQAAMLNAQLEMAKAQTIAQAPLAQQGSAMNAANPRIRVGADMQYDGSIAGPQLEAARG